MFEGLNYNNEKTNSITSPILIYTMICMIVGQTRSVLLFLLEEVGMFYLTMHSTHFIYGYMVSDIS